MKGDKTCLALTGEGERSSPSSVGCPLAPGFSVRRVKVTESSPGPCLPAVLTLPVLSCGTVGPGQLGGPGPLSNSVVLLRKKLTFCP